MTEKETDMKPAVDSNATPAGFAAEAAAEVPAPEKPAEKPIPRHGG